MSTTDSNIAGPELVDVSDRLRQQGWRSEDWLAVILGLSILISAFLCAWSTVEPTGTHPWKPWVGKPGTWTANPLDSLSSPGQLLDKWKIVLGPLIVSVVGFGLARRAQGESARAMLIAFPAMFLLGTLAFVLAGQATVKHFNLEYALWALVVGLLISNTVGVPDWLRPAVLTELYIKTGLVLLGGEVLLNRLLALGLPGILVAWLVTPVVLITTYWFGTKVLRIPSRSLNMVISADMSVCGVSAAIATAASCRAKKEELSFAIALSLTFTVVMMVVMPMVIRASGMSEIVGGAWLGGTIDSTGAVAAAGSALGDLAEQTAATVKMIQNILIGVTAFGVAVYWVVFVERDSDSGVRPDVREIWRRFPKFVLGFVFASLLFTLLGLKMNSATEVIQGGEQLVSMTVKEATKGIREWFFCLAFVSIGLESRLRDLRQQIHGGKPILLYVCGQSLNLVLTLLMAYWMFGVVFAEFINERLKQ